MSLVGFTLLDATTRTWAALWSTISLFLFYGWWNASSLTPHHFDPYPYTFLMVLVAAFSYLQNIIIMTLQRQQDAQFNAIKAKQDEQDRHMLNLMETATAQGRFLITLSHKDAQRDNKILAVFETLPCRGER